VWPDRRSLGQAAAAAAALHLQRLLRRADRVRVAFAAAPSQEEFLAALALQPGIRWDRVVAFHLDEYVGLPPGAPQRFAHWLAPRVWDRLPLRAAHRIDGSAEDPAAEAARYEALLRRQRLHLCCLGIGENGHVAFNDPPVADFRDPQLVKVVELDERCRAQQVHDGAFPDLGTVPRRAITLTIPALVGAAHLVVVVPGSAKAEAVRDALLGPVEARCPASVLREHPGAALFLDRGAAALLP
jgi:glucosamine-6-phosphate deaminase